MKSFQELKLSRILSFPVRSWECTVPLVPPFQFQAEVELLTGRFLFSGTSRTSHMLDLIIRLLGWTDTQKIESLEKTGDVFSNSSLSPFSRHLSLSPIMTAVTVPLALSAGTTLSVSVIPATSIIAAFLLQRHLHFLSGLAHQLESDIGCYILHVGVHSCMWIDTQQAFPCISDTGNIECGNKERCTLAVGITKRFKHLYFTGKFRFIKKVLRWFAEYNWLQNIFDLAGCAKLHSRGLERSSQRQRCWQDGQNQSRLNSLMHT